MRSPGESRGFVVEWTSVNFVAMRFLANEHSDVIAALREHGVDPDRVLFVKRRGRLHVQVPDRTDTFAFFRKKSTRIDAAHEWEHRTDYFIGAANGPSCSWVDVMAAFRAWLKKPR